MLRSPLREKGEAMFLERRSSRDLRPRHLCRGLCQWTSLGVALPHAWVTLDGVHAVDVTWDAPADCHYVGVAFPKEIVARHCLDEQRYAVSLLSNSKPSAALRELLAAAPRDVA